MLSLKLSFDLAVVGERGLAELVELLYDRTRAVARLIERRPGFSCLCAPDANILCFRYGTDSALQDRIRQRLVLEGHSRRELPAPLGHERHVEALCDRIEAIARERAPGERNPALDGVAASQAGEAARRPRRHPDSP